MAYPDTDPDERTELPAPESSRPEPEEIMDSLGPGSVPAVAPPDLTNPETKRRLEEIRLRAGKESEEAGQEAKRLIEERQDIQRRRDEELAPLRQQAGASAGAEIPTPPSFRPLPAAPKPTLGPNAENNDHEWLTAAMFLGSLGGALTRRPITNALAAFTGAIQGYTEGKKDIFHQQMEVWRAENEKALRENERAQKDYENVLKNQQLTTQQKMFQLQIVSQKYQDDAMANAAATKDTIAVGQLADQRLRYATDMTKAGGAMLQEQIDMVKAEVKNSPDVTHKMVIGETRWPNINSGPMVARIGAQERIKAILAEDSHATEADFEKFRAAARAEGSSLARVRAREMTQRLGLFNVTAANAVSFQTSALDHLLVLRETIGDLQNVDVNVFNKYKLDILQQLGGTGPTNFDAAKQIIGNEVVRAITTYGGGVYDRQEIAKVLERQRSPAQLFGMARVYERLIAAQVASRQRQYEFSRSGIATAPPFEEMLTPRVTKLIREGDFAGFSVGLPVNNHPESRLETDVDGKKVEAPVLDPAVRTRWRAEAERHPDVAVGRGSAPAAPAAPSKPSTALDDIEHSLNEGTRYLNEGTLEAAKRGAETFSGTSKNVGGGLRDIAKGEEPSWLRSVLPAGWTVRPRHHLPGSAAAREEEARRNPPPQPPPPSRRRPAPSPSSTPPPTPTPPPSFDSLAPGGVPLLGP